MSADYTMKRQATVLPILSLISSNSDIKKDHLIEKLTNCYKHRHANSSGAQRLEVGTRDGRGATETLMEITPQLANPLSQAHFRLV
jgi:hypothetical protein